MSLCSFVAAEYDDLPDAVKSECRLSPTSTRTKALPFRPRFYPKPLDQPASTLGFTAASG